MSDIPICTNATSNLYDSCGNAHLASYEDPLLSGEHNWCKLKTVYCCTVQIKLEASYVPIHDPKESYHLCCISEIYNN